MERLVVKNSIWKNLIYLLGSFLFVSLGCFVLSINKNSFETILAWSCIIFFGIGVLIFIKRILDPRPRIIIDRVGIFDRTLKIGIIEWQDIQYASLNSISKTDFISLVLRDDKKYLQRSNKIFAKLAQFNKTLGFEAININLSGTNVNSKEIFDFVINQLKVTKIKSLKNLNYELKLQNPYKNDVVSDRSNDS